MSMLERIREGIATHRSLANKDPDMVVLSASAFEKLLDEGKPYTLARSVDPTKPSNVDGVPIKVLPDLPRNYVGVVGGA
jgi:hypothetical protein